MSTMDDESSMGRTVRQCQIIAGAMIVGLTIFMGIASVVDFRSPPAGGGAAPGQGVDVGRILTWAALAFAALDLPLSFLIPTLIAGQNRRAIAAGTWAAPKGPAGTEGPTTDAGRLSAAYMTQFIVGAALTEGAAFFAGIAYMIGKDPIALGLGILLIGVLIARFPTTERVAGWISHQEEMLIQERQAA